MKQETFKDWVSKNVNVFLVVLGIFAIIVQLSNYQENTLKTEKMVDKEITHLDSISTLNVYIKKYTIKAKDDSIRMVTMVKLMQQQSQIMRDLNAENKALRKQIKLLNDVKSN